MFLGLITRVGRHTPHATIPSASCYRAVRSFRPTVAGWTRVGPKAKKKSSPLDSLPFSSTKPKALPPPPEDAKVMAENRAVSGKTFEGLDGELHATTETPPDPTDVAAVSPPTEEMLLPSIAGPKAMTIRGVVFDTTGAVTQLDQEFQRAQICAENTLQPRDLRKLDTSLADQSQVILVRQRAILVNLAHVRALIRADRVTIVSTPSDNPDTAQLQSAFIYELQGKLQVAKDSTVFEIKVMESILSSVSIGLQQELLLYEREADELLASIDISVDGDKLKRLLLLRRSYNTFMQRVQNFHKALTELLDNDEDLSGMYLTDKQNGAPRAVSEHMEMELMMEHYAKIADEFVSRILETTSNLHTTTKMIGVSLDQTRNQLIVFDLQANIATAAVTSASLVAALFGMNLPNHIDSLPWVFPAVCVGSIVLARAIYAGATMRMSKIMKWKGLLGRQTDI